MLGEVSHFVSIIIRSRGFEDFEEAEVVFVDGFLSNVLWVSRFMASQGVPLKNELHQDNKSSILLYSKGRSSLGKCSQEMNVRYFAIKDHLDQGEIRINYCGTEKMVGDYFTKPLQGQHFYEFRNLILGHPGSESGSQTSKIPWGLDSVVQEYPRSITESRTSIPNPEKPLRK